MNFPKSAWISKCYTFENPKSLYHGCKYWTTPNGIGKKLTILKKLTIKKKNLRLKKKNLRLKKKTYDKKKKYSHIVFPLDI